MTHRAKQQRTPAACTAAIVVPLALAACETTPAADSASTGAPTIRGAAIVTLSDGDMPYSIIADGALRPPGFTPATDALSLIRLPIPDPGSAPGARTAASYVSAPISNSALGPPRTLAILPGGSRALVLSTRGAAPESAASISDLPPGGPLSLVDLSANPPFTAASIDVGPRVSSLSVNRAGDLAVVARSTPDLNELVFVRIDGAALSIAARIPFTDVKPGPGIALGSAMFSPDGAALAVTVLGEDAVFFMRLIRDQGLLGVRAWGPPVRVGNFPFTGAWSNDGRHFFTCDLNWGKPGAYDLINAPPGSLSVIRLSAEDTPESAHVLASQVSVGVGNEGLAVSPVGADADHDLLAIGNLRRSFLPASDSRFTRGGSFNLVAVDRRTGEARVLGEWPCAAGPQGLAFDSRGDALLVPDFEDGVLQVWRIRRDGGSARAEFTGVRIGVPQGPHEVAVIP